MKIDGKDKLVFGYKRSKQLPKFPIHEPEISYLVVTSEGVVLGYDQEEDGFYIKKDYYGYGLHFESEKDAQKVADLLNESYETLDAEVIKEKF